MKRRPTTSARAPAPVRRGATRGIAVVAASLVVAGCPAESAPVGDDALGAYLDRHGVRTVIQDDVSVAVEQPVAPIAMARRLAITVVSARDLPDLDSGPGVTDPYVVLQIDGQRHRTTVIEGSQNPVWGDSFVVEVGPSPVIEITLKDEDSMSSDETIGVVSRVLEPIAVGRTVEIEVPFREGAGGYLTLRLSGLGARDGDRRP